ncbi:MAG: GH116 family glycosyl hydrolase, partial [Candidatus Hodarchaeota archaeon]
YKGILVRHESGVEYTIGTIDQERVITGGGLGIDGGAWARVGMGSHFSKNYWRWYDLPQAKGQTSASVAVHFSIEPGDTEVFQFMLTWYAPRWISGGRIESEGNEFYHYYAKYYKSAVDVVEFMLPRLSSVLNRVIKWQQEIYKEKTMPVWLRESLVNILHLITECGVWAQARSPIGSWCKDEDGLFALNESPRACPQMECIPCSFYGNFPLVFFFPELALSTLRAYKGYQFEDGQVPWVFGGCTDSSHSPPYELVGPSRGYSKKPQTSLDGTCYISMFDRLYLYLKAQSMESIQARYIIEPEDFLNEFYESVKENTSYTMQLRPEAGDRGVVMAPSGDDFSDWFESVDLKGIIPHLGAVHLAHLKIAGKLAGLVNDPDFSKQCQSWFETGKEILDNEAWEGENYYLYVNPETGTKNDVVFSYQLDGEWIAKIHGVAPVLDLDHINTTLETIKRTSVTKRGPIVFKRIDENKFHPGYWGESGMHVGGGLMLAMLYIYHGEEDYGMDLAHRIMKSLIVENGCSWDSLILINCLTGQRIYGNDYYQNLILWTLPAALQKKDIGSFCEPGGLIARILEAGKMQEKA